MGVIVVNFKKCGWICGVALLLAGCALPVSAPSAADTANDAHSAIQRPTRTIIYFQRPAAENKQLTNAISEACNCQPVFFRAYLKNALIYEITLPQGETFAAFEQALMRNAVRLEINAVEQDRVMQHQ